MVLPPGGFFVLAGWLIAFAAFDHYKSKRTLGVQA
jgi:hypothetical protein